MKIIMDQQKQIKSIEDVQEAETHATKALSSAMKEKEETIAQAKEKAAAMIADAINESRQKHDQTIKKFLTELEDKKKKALEKAAKDSKSIKSTHLSQQKGKDVVNKLVKIVLGE
jgi:vacuolar-type H+-ATPase subunit H